MSYKNILVFIVVFIAVATTLISNVSSSEYGIVNTFTEEKNITKLGLSNVTKLILNKNILNRTTTILNFSNQNIQQFDYVLIGTESITIDGVVYSQGSTKSYDSAGVHTYCKVSDPTICGSFSITSLNDPIIEVEISSRELNFTWDKKTITLNEEKTLNLSVNVDADLSPGTYEYTITIDDKEIEKLLIIENIYNWNYTQTTYKGSIETGTHGTILTLELLNRGNEFAVVDIEVLDDESIIYADKDMLLYPGISKTLEVLYDVNIGRVIGKYDFSIRLSHLDTTEIIHYNYTIKDSVAPIITELNVSDIIVHEPTMFSFEATDNNNVTRALLKYKKQGTVNPTEVILTPFENNYYIDRETTFDKLENYTVQACVFDSSNNSMCSDEISYKVLKSDNVDIVGNTVHIKKSKYGEYKIVPLFNLSKEMRVIIKLDQLSYTNVSEEWTIKIIDGDGNSEYFIENIGDEVTIKEPGEIKIGFRGEKEKEFGGTLTLLPEWYNVDIGDITFSGQVIDYVIPEPFERDWYGNDLSCSVEDTGDIDTSYYDCNIRMSILQDIENTAIPITPADKEQNSKSWEDQLKVWKEKNSGKIIVIILLAIFLILTLGFVLFQWLYAHRIFIKIR